MLARPDLSLIVPAYNEARSIGQTLDDVQSYLDQRAFGMRSLSARMGTTARASWSEKEWQTMRDCVLQAVRSGTARDAECERGKPGSGQHRRLRRRRQQDSIEELAKLLPFFDQGYEIVIGSRGQADSRIEVPQPLHRKLGSRGFAMAMHLLLGMWHIRDTQCGFKFFRRQVALDLFGRQRIDGYMFDVEILYLACRAGYRIKEVGVRWRDDGDSRLNLVAGNWRNLLDIVKIRCGRRSPPRCSAARDRKAA